VFAILPRLLERAGNSEKGSITAFYTVLVEGDDMTEPVADEVRSILDGHIILSRDLSARGHFPAIDVLRSASRVFTAVASPEHQKASQKVRELVASYERNRDLLLLGAYKPGTDARVDEAVDRYPGIEAFLRQGTHEKDEFGPTIDRMAQAGG
jgi:type III secretion protein N (ATPase)